MRYHYNMTYASESETALSLEIIQQDMSHANVGAWYSDGSSVNLMSNNLVGLAETEDDFGPSNFNTGSIGYGIIGAATVLAFTF